MKSLYRSFAGGEISPELYGRPELTAYQTGLATCRNAIVLPHGPISNRPGTEFVREVKDSTKRVRLIPFEYSSTQTMILEFGQNYIRFHTDGGTLVTGGSTPYEVATPYVEADLFDLHYVQSADVMTITHPKYAPRELRRLGALNWTLVAINFSTTQGGAGNRFLTTSSTTHPYPNLPAPEFVSVSPTVTGSTSLEYGVQAITNDDQTFTPAPMATAFALGDENATVNVTWGAVGGAIGYRVYRNSGYFRLIAETAETSYADNRTALTLYGPNYWQEPNCKQNYYRVTLVGYDGQESLSTVVRNEFYDLTRVGNRVVVEILDDVGVEYKTFNVYKADDSMRFGYIGYANFGSKFSDDNIEPDYTRQPPEDNVPFTGATSWPQACSYFQQRRLFGGTLDQPQNVWASRTGTESNFTTNAVVRADDAISFRVAALKISTIRHIVPLGDVILLSNNGEWRLDSTDGGGITPSTISVKPQSYVGANNVQPVVTDSSILYAQARGGHIREIVYTMSDNGAVGYGNADLSLLAPHLFNYKTIVDLAFAKAPYPILWAVSSDGKLLGMTYVPDQKVAGWHRHDTDGAFESCAVVTEGEEDSLYVVVRRTINGASKRYVERMHTRKFTDLKDGFFVDCGDTYTGAPFTTISGLGHLEGKKVAVLGDGATFPQKTVTGGQINLEKAVSVAHIGLPIVCDITTLPMTSDQIEAFGQGRNKNVSKAYLKVVQSSGVKCGPDATKLREFKQRTTEPFDSAPRIIASAEIEIEVPGTWTTGGQLTVRQDQPLPLTVLSMALEVSVAG